ncbi:unnamed protein product, partial [Strongylus vulgaris]
MITKLIMAYPYHVLHSVLLYKFDENRAPVVQSMLEEAERRIANEKDRARLHEIIEDMTAAHVAYLQFVALGFPRDYSGDELVKWEVIERECMQADGLSAPKVTRVRGSDGKLYKLIWK